VEQMIIPVVENPVTLSLYLTELDDSCGSLQEDVQPVAQMYNATPGTILSTSLSWNVSTVDMYLQQNASYCFIVVSDGPIRFTLDLVYTPHSPWIQTSYIQGRRRKSLLLLFFSPSNS
jgi:hypothetical protein